MQQRSSGQSGPAASRRSASVSTAMTRTRGGRLMRGFTFWTALFVPGFFAGLSIVIEHIYRRRIVMNTFYNMTLNYLYLRARVAGLVRRTAAGETAAFMAINGLLLYLLHKASKASTTATAGGRSAPVFWFFIPDGVKSDAGQDLKSKRICPVPHKGTCWESALQTTAKYSALAAVIQAMRVIMDRGSQITPNVFFRDFLSGKTGAGIASLGGYVLLYKATRCVLAMRRGSDMCQHSAVGGLIAGSAYWLQPNTTILSSAIIATFRLLLDYLPKRGKRLVQRPMPELIFALCTGILFHARCMDMAYCPKFVIHMIDTATQNRSKLIYNAYMQQVSRIQQTT